MARKTGGTRGDVRQSALWGSGNRGGEFRSNALWGKGGRGLATTVAVVVLALPLAAGAGGGKGPSAPATAGGYVSAELKNDAKTRPNDLVQVIVQADAMDKAEKATKLLGKLQARLGLIDGVAVELRAKEVEKLEKVPGLIVTRDAPVMKSGYTSSQLWAHETGINKLWAGPKAPTIAIVDSGIDSSRLDVAGRVKAEVNFVSSGNPNSAGDGRGHGTFVAGIAAGAAPGYAGAAPSADLVSLDVMDDSGRGLTSDVIKAAEWIYANKDAYGIRVANFSLHSASVNHFYNDPLNKAVEKLWFAGVTVVAAAGNYGTDGAPSGVKYAPGSDPFVITVGAVDIGGTARVGDDDRAPWSAYGRTPDGFWKPDICSVGRYMVGPVPVASTLAKEKADKLRGTGYIELSGTSFSTPVISGLAAQILAYHPSWGPDQVKGALMRRSRPVPRGESRSCGVGQVNAVAAVLGTREAPNPNAALNRYVESASGGSGRMFNAVSWTDAIKANVSWDAVSWTDVSWNDVSWDAVSWSDVSWTDVSWTDSVSWSDVSWEDGADGDALDGDGYELTPTEAGSAATDPELLAPGEVLPTVATAPATTTSSTTTEPVAAATTTATTSTTVSEPVAGATTSVTEPVASATATEPVASATTTASEPLASATTTSTSTTTSLLP